MIDWTNPVQTVDGQKLRVLCTDRIENGKYPVVCLREPDWFCYLYTLDGKPETGNPDKVAINMPDNRDLDGWLNVYPDRCHPRFHTSRESADANAFDNRIACIKIKQTYTVGEGL
jgi:hypothetical protein